MALKKRSFTLSGHRTSIALEPEFWAVLEADAQGGSLASFVAEVDRTRGERPLASALRLKALEIAAGRTADTLLKLYTRVMARECGPPR